MSSENCVWVGCRAFPQTFVSARLLSMPLMQERRHWPSTSRVRRRSSASREFQLPLSRHGSHGHSIFCSAEGVAAIACHKMIAVLSPFGTTDPPASRIFSSYLAGGGWWIASQTILINGECATK